MCGAATKLHEWAKPALCVCVLRFHYKLFIVQIVFYPIREECSLLHVKMTINSSLYPAMHTSRLLDVAQPLVTRVLSQFFFSFKFHWTRHRHFFFTGDVIIPFWACLSHSMLCRNMCVWLRDVVYSLPFLDQLWVRISPLEFNTPWRIYFIKIFYLNSSDVVCAWALD